MKTNKQEYRKLVWRSVLTGFIGGIFLIGFSYLFYIFNFIKISPEAYIIRTWTNNLWTNRWQGEIATILLGALISVFIAYLYFLLFKKIFSLWLTIIFGLVLWAIISFSFPALFTNIPAVHTLDSNTIVSSIGLFILYGTFIGYSISFDYRQTTSETFDSK